MGLRKTALSYIYDLIRRWYRVRRYNRKVKVIFGTKTDVKL